MKTSMYVFDKNYMKDEMESISAEIHDKCFFDEMKKIYDKKINITDNPDLKKAIDLIDENYSIGSYETFFLDYIHNTLPNDNKATKNYLVECYIIEKLMEVGKLASIQECKTNDSILREVEDTVTNQGPYHLIQMFHNPEKEYDMMKLFVDYEFRNTNLKDNELLDSLEDTKRNIEFYYATEIYKREIHQKRDYLLNRLNWLLENQQAWQTLKFIDSLEYKAIICELKEYNKLGFDDVIIPIESLKKILASLLTTDTYYMNQLTKKK